jgi:LysM repeat protein
MARSARWTPLALALIGLPGALSAQQTHKVAAGETLWSLSQQYYSDPYKWPQIYEANRAGIQDPHWIYPGQDLIIPNVAASVTTVAVTPAQPAAEPAAPPPPAPVQDRDPERTVFYQPAPTSGFGLLAALDQQRVAVPRDVSYSAPWLVPTGAPTGSIGHLVEFAGAEDEQIVRKTAMDFDRLEVAFDGATPARGTELLAFRVDHTIPGLGDVLVPTGVVAVSDPVPGGAVVLVVDVFDRLSMGDLLIPVPTFSLQPGARAVPSNTGADATIVGFAMPHTLQDMHDVAFLDQGSDNGVKVGDEYVLVWVEGTGTPPVEEGRLQVISVHPDHASAQIVDMRNAIFTTGVRVRLDRRMP